MTTEIGSDFVKHKSDLPSIYTSPRWISDMAALQSGSRFVTRDLANLRVITHHNVEVASLSQFFKKINRPLLEKCVHVVNHDKSILQTIARVQVCKANASLPFLEKREFNYTETAYPEYGGFVDFLYCMDDLLLETKRQAAQNTADIEQGVADVQLGYETPQRQLRRRTPQNPLSDFWVTPERSQAHSDQDQLSPVAWESPLYPLSIGRAAFIPTPDKPGEGGEETSRIGPLNEQFTVTMIGSLLRQISIFAGLNIRVRMLQTLFKVNKTSGEKLFSAKADFSITQADGKAVIGLGECKRLRRHEGIDQRAAQTEEAAELVARLAAGGPLPATYKLDEQGHNGFTWLIGVGAWHATISIAHFSDDYQSFLRDECPSQSGTFMTITEYGKYALDEGQGLQDLIRDLLFLFSLAEP